jgi:hypothetical protein
MAAPGFRPLCAGLRSRLPGSLAHGWVAADRSQQPSTCRCKAGTIRRSARQSGCHPQALALTRAANCYRSTRRRSAGPGSHLRSCRRWLSSINRFLSAAMHSRPRPAQITAGICVGARGLRPLGVSPSRVATRRALGQPAQLCIYASPPCAMNLRFCRWWRGGVDDGAGSAMEGGIASDQAGGRWTWRARCSRWPMRWRQS